MRDIAASADNARWGEFFVKYEPMVRAYLESRFPQIEAEVRNGWNLSKYVVKIRETEVGHNRANAWGFYDAIGNGYPLVTSPDGKRLYGLGQYNLDELPKSADWCWIGVFRVCIGTSLPR